MTLMGGVCLCYYAFFLTLEHIWRKTNGGGVVKSIDRGAATRPFYIIDYSDFRVYPASAPLVGPLYIPSQLDMTDRLLASGFKLAAKAPPGAGAERRDFPDTGGGYPDGIAR